MKLKLIAISLISIMSTGNVILNAAEELGEGWEEVPIGQAPAPTLRIQNYSSYPLNITYQIAGQQQTRHVDPQGIVDIDYNVQDNIMVTTEPKWWQSATQMIAPTVITAAAAFLGISDYATAIRTVSNFINTPQKSITINHARKYPAGTRFVFYWPIYLVAINFNPVIIPLSDIDLANKWDSVSAKLEGIMQSGVGGAGFALKILKEFIQDFYHRPTEDLINQIDNQADDFIQARQLGQYTIYPEYEQPQQPE